MIDGFLSIGNTFSISIASMLGIAFLSTLVFTPVMRKLALMWGIFDHPNRRKMHSRPVPYFGGVAMFCGFFLALALLAGWDNHLTGFALGALIMLVVGMIDDLISISPVFKLLGQTVAALVMVSFGVRIEYISNFLRGTGVIYLGIWSIPITVSWLVMVTNTVNLIDGLDGLAAGVSVIASVTLLIVGILDNQVPLILLLTAGLAGASGAFLFFNFYPASIFMGDSGSLFLGFSLATVGVMGALKGATIATLVIPVLALGVPIYDTALAIFRRGAAGTQVFKPDKEHFHHRIMALGFTQTQTVLFIYGISAILGMCAVYLTTINDASSLIVLTFIGLLFIIGTDQITRRIKYRQRRTRGDR